MRYLFAFFIPPLALLVCHKPVQFVVNLVLWLISLPLLLFFGIGFFVWFACTAHALIVCASCRQEAQMNRLVTAIQGRQPAAGE